MPICTIFENLTNKWVAEKYYPQYVCKGKLPSEVTAVIKRQVSGLMVSKVCGTLRNSLDSIILSAFIGLVVVGIYGNYYYVLNAVHGVLTIVGTSMKAGVGNSIVKESKEKNYHDYQKFSFLYSWIAGWFACCMFCLYQPFMLVWTGSEQMLFSVSLMSLFCVYFFVLCMSDMRNVYMDAIGLWWEARYRSIFECVANLICNILFGYLWGVTGVVLATLITYITINLTYGTKILFDNFFTEENLWNYLWSQFKYFLATCCVTAICAVICKFITGSSMNILIKRAGICIVVPNLLFLALDRKSVV